ncbi:hypothetical protein F4777DRAFT_579525 [Nemania sp. FL0916]|nr:hypothetical protein F4777DRAFT_579525 [Nemania sp. FL0916]
MSPFSIRLVLARVLLIAYIGATCGSQATRSGKLIPSSQDSCYSATPRSKSYSPRTVLRVLRRAPSEIAAFAVNSTSAVYQILYRATDTRHRLSWAVTTLYLPIKASQMGKDGRVLISCQIPYNIANFDESPSAGLNNVRITAFVQSSPTRLGRGRAVLDAIWAVLASELFASAEAIRYTLCGSPGGAFASNAAAERWAPYAPELTFPGMAISGLAPKFTELALMLPAPFPGLQRCA